MFERLGAAILLSGLTAVTVGCRGSGSTERIGSVEPRPGSVSPGRSVIPQPIQQRDSALRRERQLARYGLNNDQPVKSSSIQLAAARQPESGMKRVRQAAHVFPRPASEPARLAEPPPVPPAPAAEKNEKLQPPIPHIAKVEHVGGMTITEEARPIDLSTSLALVAGQNPQVGYVQQRVAEACAQLQRAESLWLPSLRAGASYNKHEGTIQQVAGNVFNVSRGSTYTGFGARAVGTGSPAIPGLYAQFHLADAIFQPLIAERTVSARQYAASATTNNLLLQAAQSYIDLELAIERNRVAEETLAELKKLADLTASFAKRGQAPQADADRAKTELELQKNQVTRSVEFAQKASSRLTEVLSLEHDMELRPSGPAFPPTELVDATADLYSLLERAVANRPEMSQSLMQISAASNRYKKERYSPFIPHVGGGMSWGGFGGGMGDSVTNYQDRLDLDAWMYWEVRNLGLGERAARNAAGARVHQEQYQYARLANRIRREVKEAYAELLSAKKQVQQAEASVKAAEASYKRNDQRIRNVQGLPIEVLQSIRALDAAKRELVNARAAYNRAQFRVHHAIGWPTGE